MNRSDRRTAETITDRWNEWREQRLEDPDLVSELRTLEEKVEELTDRFYKDLEFGTGGLRGLLGVGTNCMNVYTVAKATKGYSNYLNRGFASPSVAIAFDSRKKSDVFARTAAKVFAENGIKVYLYRELAPTPALSFAVRYLSCSGGVVITASHNPAQYNGYKVYGSDGCQITNQAADEILAEIQRTDIFKDTRGADFEECVRDGRISYIGDDVITSYINAVSEEAAVISEETAGIPEETAGQAISGQAISHTSQLNKTLSIIYTPLYGTGRYYVTRALRENGFSNVMLVKEQEYPDGNFPTCPYPNPEIREALALGIEYAKRLGSDLLLATDPDCDRVGTAVKSESGYVLLSGNEMGLLLFDYICRRRIALGTMPKNPVLVKTIVTTDMAKKIAEDYGVEVIDVLTGFKYIGEQIGLLEAAGQTERYIFGFEESYGYLSGSYVRDKDGVNTALLICEMFAYYRAQEQSVLEVLEGLYKKYGYCLNTLKTYAFEGAEGFQKMKQIMECFRASQPDSLAGKSVEAVSDFRASLTRYRNGREEPIALPCSDVLKFILDGGTTAVMRPSGTEPKLKLYLSVSAAGREIAEEIEKRIVYEIEQLFSKDLC